MADYYVEDYYADYYYEKDCSLGDAAEGNDPPSKVKLLPEMSRAIFKQDGLQLIAPRKSRIGAVATSQVSRRMARAR